MLCDMMVRSAVKQAKTTLRSASLDEASRVKSFFSVRDTLRFFGGYKTFTILLKVIQFVTKNAEKISDGVSREKSRAADYGLF